MSKALAEQLRKKRLFDLVVGDLKLKARRPNDLEMAVVFRDSLNDCEVAQRFIVGWEGMSEDRVVGGGGTDLIEFSEEVWAEYVADHIELWKPIAQKILDAFTAHKTEMADAQKN